MKNTIKHIIAFILILLLTFGVSILLYVWFEYPRGNDAVSHLFKIKFILDFYPHINWVHAWAGGMPMFSLYPSLPYLLLAAIQKLSGLSLPLVLTGTTVFFGVGVAGFGIYLLVHKVTKSWLAGLAASFIYISTPGVWSLAFSGGLYSRALAVPFFTLSLWAAVSLWFIDEKTRTRKLFFVLTTIFLGLSLLFHYSVGTVALLSVFLLGLFLTSDVRERLWEVFKLSLLAILVAASFLVSFVTIGSSFANLVVVPDFLWRNILLLTPMSRVFYLVDTSRGPLEIGRFLSPPHWHRLTPFLLPLFLPLFVFVLGLKRKNLSPKIIRLVLYFVFMTFLWFLYMSYIFPFLKIIYYTLGGPILGLSYLPVFIAPAVGILASYICSKKTLKHLINLIFGGAVVVWFIFQFGIVWKHSKYPYIRLKASGNVIFQLAEEILPARNQFNFRLGDGNDNGTLASWLNIKYPLIPQTRDYFFQGVVNKDYYAQKDFVIWHQNDNYEETDFLLDWWAVQQFLVGHDGEVENKFKGKVQYGLLGESLVVDAYYFRQASPVLSATNTPTVLVVGEGAYDSAFRALGRGNINSQEVIPIHGQSFVDDYSLDELKHFEVVFLYNYQFHNNKRALELLCAYVEQGGRLVIESNITLEASGEISDPFPVNSIERGEVEGDWKFISNSQLTDEVNFAEFGPPIFQEGPWGISFAKEIKEWGEVLVSAGDKPIVISGQFGKGEVVWSGLNLPFHTNAYNNSQEAKFLASLLLGKNIIQRQVDEVEVGESDVYKTDTYNINRSEISKLGSAQDKVFEGDGYKVTFINPQKREVDLEKPFSGILFKEFYYRNWHAYLEKDGRKEKLTIFKAGPEFMYVLLDGVGVGDKVVLQYRRSLFEQASMLISILTLFGLIFYLFDWWIFKPYLEKVGQRLISPFKKLTTWWKSEDV